MSEKNEKNYKSSKRPQSSLRRRATTQLDEKGGSLKNNRTSDTGRNRKTSNTSDIPPINVSNYRRSHSTMTYLSVNRDLESIRSGNGIPRSPSLSSVDSNFRYLLAKPKLGPNSSRCTSSMSGMGSIEKSSSGIWQEFEEHIMSIDTDSMHFQTKPTTSKGSETLKALLEEEFMKKNGVPLSAKKLVHKFKENMMDNTLVESENEESEEEHHKRTTADEQKVPSHVWNKVKIDVQEKHLEKRLSEQVDGWKLISHTAPYLNDAQKARRVLYERYIENPHGWVEGLQNYEKYKHIFEEHESHSTKAYVYRQNRKNASKSGEGFEKRPKTSCELGKHKLNEKASKRSKQCVRPMTAVEVF